ncbi:MAG: zinc ribbon domain-containing protein [Bacillota bacterium]
MPIYEFKCEACGRQFEDLCPVDVGCQKCPHCGSGEVVKLISAFAARSHGSEGTQSLSSGGSCASCQGGNCHGCH